MTDETFELKEKIWVAVHDLVDKMTEGLSEDEDYDLRQSLTDEFRFWRRFPRYKSSADYEQIFANVMAEEFKKEFDKEVLKNVIESLKNEK